MEINRIQTVVHEITDLQGLDPIRVSYHDIAPGQGRLTVECFGRCWAYYWGAMGKRDLMLFVSECDADYITNALLSSSGVKRTKKEYEYLKRIITAIKQSLLQPA
jgi:hypothetical protein